MQKQVHSSHYVFDKYVSNRRWASIWHQLDEVNKLKPKNVLEIGPGPGLFKAMGTALGLHVETLDIDAEIKPDHIASVFSMPFEDGAFDVVCAFQMLEHLPFEKSLEAFAEMNRVAKCGIVTSLPDAATCWSFSAHIPKVGLKWLHIPKPYWGMREHHFDGEHYWEINKVGYPTDLIIAELKKRTNKKLQHTYRVNENPYHRFFCFEYIS
jgi:SAM-dependent methyltransferase